MKMFSTIQRPSFSMTWITLSLFPPPMSAKGRSLAPRCTALGAASIIMGNRPLWLVSSCLPGVVRVVMAVDDGAHVGLKGSRVVCAHDHRDRTRRSGDKGRLAALFVRRPP